MASLAKKIDEKLQENPSLRGFVVVLTEDSDKSRDELKKLAEDKGIKNLPLTLYEGKAGPPAIRLSEEADVTVLLWVGTTVKANHAFGDGELNDEAIAKVIADIPKILE